MKKEALFILKIGGNILNNPAGLDSFLLALQAYKDHNIILVHGGGKLLETMAQKTGVRQTKIDGRRITDAATMELATMVYAGSINKTVVAKMQALSIPAIGLTGADGNAMRAKKRQHPDINFGLVGDVQSAGINANFISSLIELNMVPVFCSITHDGNGQLLNTNADTVAGNLAIAMAGQYEVHLYYCFEKAGVLQDQQDENSVIKEISLTSLDSLIVDGTISEGMLPKLENAFQAKHQGVETVAISSAENIHAFFTHSSPGTIII